MSTSSQQSQPRRRSKAKDDGLSSAQRNWKLDFAQRHGITAPLLDPDPKTPEQQLRARGHGDS